MFVGIGGRYRSNPVTSGSLLGWFPFGGSFTHHYRVPSMCKQMSVGTYHASRRPVPGPRIRVGG